MNKRIAKKIFLTDRPEAYTKAQHTKSIYKICAKALAMLTKYYERKENQPCS